MANVLKSMLLFRHMKMRMVSETDSFLQTSQCFKLVEEQTDTKYWKMWGTENPHITAKQERFS